MKNKDWKLSQPIKINGLSLKNRMVMLPMSNKLHSATGEVTQRLIDYYEERAKGGTGLIIVQLALVTPEFGSSRLNISSGNFLGGLSDLAECIKSHACRVALQIGHRGYPLYDGRTVNDLDEAEILKLVDAFGKAAERVKIAGFEAVEIHGGHGYLITQFLSGLSNKRTDAYGGSLERRMHFPIQVYRKVRQAVGDRFPVFYRLSVSEFVPGGISVEDTKKIAMALEKEGINLLSLSAGNRETNELTILQMAFPRGYHMDSYGEVKKSVKIPVLVAGRINDPVLANRILEDSKADLVGIGRGLIADPRFPEKALSGELDDIRKCIACMYCQGKRNILDLPIRCAVNPSAGREKDTILVPARKRKTVLVVGGGPAGMECSHTLIQRGHNVLLFEGMPQLGGKLRLASIPPHKEEINEFLDFLIRRTGKDKIPVFLNHEVTEKTLIDLQPDVLVYASGSKPVFPEIPGLKRESVYLAEEALTNDMPQDRILILGGGWVGCEVAEFLAARGKKITLLEKLENIGFGVDPRTLKLMLQRISKTGMTIHTNADVTKIDQDKVFFKDKDGNENIAKCEAIVLAVGYVSNDDFMKSTKELIAETYSIGDCAVPRGIFEAIQEGSAIGRII
jgi:2,4-dienoyl-CoA reductase-like NADH-dependent reductase (Old Yellow Enzyme family)/thioredoxin reductase